jgi:hypothetical protein
MASTQQSISTRSRPTVSSRISAVGAKIARALSRDRDTTSRPGYDPETESLASTVVERGESPIPRYNPLIVVDVVRIELTVPLTLTRVPCILSLLALLLTRSPFFRLLSRLRGRVSLASLASHAFNRPRRPWQHQGLPTCRQPIMLTSTTRVEADENIHAVGALSHSTQFRGRVVINIRC